MPHFDPKDQLPEGFAMAQAQAAPDAFGRLPGQEKAHYVARAHQASNKAEMRSIVSELGDHRTL